MQTLNQSTQEDRSPLLYENDKKKLSLQHCVICGYCACATELPCVDFVGVDRLFSKLLVFLFMCFIVICLTFCCHQRGCIEGPNDGPINSKGPD